MMRRAMRGSDMARGAASAHISVQFTTTEEDERQYWGQYLGSPGTKPRPINLRAPNAMIGTDSYAWYCQISAPCCLSSCR